ncbi:hypothetical protein [Brevibacterium album]|uniref:hypothetical protein n=1 Tax=Brevibacterium album TaxID=417948 RepID=UPI0004076180|nr:hypothetical protein [Brevibacterium album]
MAEAFDAEGIAGLALAAVALAGEDVIEARDGIIFGLRKIWEDAQTQDENPFTEGDFQTFEEMDVVLAEVVEQ